MPDMTDLDELLKINIGGEMRLGGGDETASLYPATGEVVARLRAPSLADVNEAIERADHAFRTSGWAQRKPHERAAVLHRVAQLIRERSEPLAQRQRLDNGKPINETRNLVVSAAGTFQFFAAACETLEETITPSRGDFMSMSVYEPMGVVAAITPWNSPIASEAQKVAPALAAGNAVVLKPAEATPLLALALAAICEEAGLPKGLISVLPGRGSVIGDAITRHPLVRRVSFTGGTATGRHIARIAADKMMPVSLELGGKSATMVLEDADLDHAVEGAMLAKMRNGGQACTAANRFLVQETVAAEFAAKLAARMGALRVGAGTDRDTQLGPMINARAVAGIADKVSRSVSAGARALIGGTVHAGAGFFYPATVLVDVPRDSAVATEEVFGPVAPIITVKDEDDALTIANASEMGLTGYVYSGDLARGLRVCERLEVGMIGLNRGLVSDPAAPFGGVKQSGLGREGGYEGIEEYLETTYVATSW